MALDEISRPLGDRRCRCVDQARIEAIAAGVAEALRREFPQIVAVGLMLGPTVEGEDAYLWVTIPAGDPKLRRRVRAVAAAKTSPYLDEGIAILPQIRLAPAAPQEAIEAPPVERTVAPLDKLARRDVPVTGPAQPSVRARAGRRRVDRAAEALSGGAARRAAGQPPPPRRD